MDRRERRKIIDKGRIREREHERRKREKMETEKARNG